MAPNTMRDLASIAIVMACLSPNSARAEPPRASEIKEFPVLGVFGEPKQNGCLSYKRGEEGAYVSFNAGRGTGEAGEVGCDYSSIVETAPSKYSLRGVCWGLEDTAKKKVRFQLIVKSANEVIYAGVRYLRCE
jgi:hypothetical protein